MLFFWIFALFLSLAILVKSSDFFTEASEKIGLIFGISPFIIGVTIVAFGTSLPELITCLISIFHNAEEIVVGNLIGSNIANILLVIGITAIVAKKIEIHRDIINLDLPLLAAGTFALILMIGWDMEINRVESFIALLFYFVYFYYLYKSRSDTVGETIEKKVEEMKEKITPRKITMGLIFTLIFSAFFLYIGAEFTIKSVIALSKILGIETSVIALSAIAIGTSLPELAVSIQAARKNNGDMALGNVFGSNLFNGSLIIGIAGIIKPLPVSNEIYYIALPFLFIATLLYFFSGLSRKIHNYEGAMFVGIYILFIAKLFKLF
ncbi:MAG: calcium/sodium antiporter [Patescibacteria group bacterium]|nr:calcium/sodium antiporter [Patescibacteria group bacterium]